MVVRRMACASRPLSICGFFAPRRAQLAAPAAACGLAGRSRPVPPIRRRTRRAGVGFLCPVRNSLCLPVSLEAEVDSDRDESEHYALYGAAQRA